MRNRLSSGSTFFLLYFCFLATFGFSQTDDQLKAYAQQIKFGVEDVKRTALFELRNFESESASRVALPALSDLSEIVRGTAIQSVIYLPKDESLKALLPLLDEKAEFIRREAAFALGETKNPSATEKLVLLMHKDKKQSVKDAAAFALGKIGDVGAVQPLTSELKKKPKKKRRFFRRVAALSIGQIAQATQERKLSLTTPESFLPEKYKEIGAPKYQSLVKSFPVFDEAKTILIRILSSKKETDNVKREAAFALGAIGDSSAIPILQSNLKSPDYYLAEICREALLKIKN